MFNPVKVYNTNTILFKSLELCLEALLNPGTQYHYLTWVFYIVSLTERDSFLYVELFRIFHSFNYYILLIQLLIAMAFKLL